MERRVVHLDLVPDLVSDPDSRTIVYIRKGCATCTSRHAKHLRFKTDIKLLEFMQLVVDGKETLR